MQAPVQPFNLGIGPISRHAWNKDKTRKLEFLLIVLSPIGNPCLSIFQKSPYRLTITRYTFSPGNEDSGNDCMFYKNTIYR